MLRGKTALITGTSGGIGLAIAKCFKNHNCKMVCLTKTKETDITEVLKFFVDLSNEKGVLDIINFLKEQKVSVDVLINNAGILHNASFQMTSIDKMKEIFEINFFAQIRLTQYIVKMMQKNKTGTIVNISSSSAFEGNAGKIAYASSKAAINCATKVMARELAPFNIRVNAIAPGMIETDILKNNFTEEMIRETTNRLCLKRIGQPEEIANVALFLASELSSYMTGQIVRVDGGML